MLSRSVRTTTLQAVRNAQLRYASTAGGPSSLLLIEHNAGKIDAGSLSALTAASQMGGEVTGLIVGSPEEIKPIIEKAKK